MTVIDNEHQAGDTSRSVATEIRAVMARKGISQRALSRALCVSPMWVSRRVGFDPQRTTPIDLDELAAIAGVLGVPVRELIPSWLPRLDSNQKPFDYRTDHCDLFDVPGDMPDPDNVVEFLSDWFELPGDHCHPQVAS